MPDSSADSAVHSSLGQIVFYTLTKRDADYINRVRAEASRKAVAEKTGVGLVAHVGEDVEAGQVFPMLITRVWSDTSVDGQVHLNGNDLVWRQSVQLADQWPAPGRWSWPARGNDL